MSFQNADSSTVNVWDPLVRLPRILRKFTLLMVAAHASGALVSSLLKGKNLVEAMVSGRKLNRSSWEDVNPGKGKENQS